MRSNQGMRSCTGNHLVAIAFALLANACSTGHDPPATSGSGGSNYATAGESGSGGRSSMSSSSGGTGTGGSKNSGVAGSTSRPFIVGVGPIWKWYYGENDDQPTPVPTLATVQDMMTGLSEVGQMVIAQSGWRAGTLGQVPSYFDDLVNVWPNPPVTEAPHPFEVISYGINFFDQGTGEAQLTTPSNASNTWASNSDAVAKYRQVALALCNAPYNARYVALALEVNTYCDRTSRDDYIYFIQNVYIPIYDAIKAVDSTIKVFVTFQLEQMKGLGTEWGFQPKNHWDMLTYYQGKLDLLAFTSYPEFVYGDPASIPADYYTSIVDAVPAAVKSTPLAFVEMGWSDRNGAADTQNTQLDFLSRFLDLTRAVNVTYMNWVFLHDEHAQPVNPKTRLGLADYNGNKRPIWDAWKALKQRAYVPNVP